MGEIAAMIAITEIASVGPRVQRRLGLVGLGVCLGLLGLRVLVSSLAAAPAPSDLSARIDRIFAKWDRNDTPGVIVAVAKDGDVVHSRGYGMADLDHGIALTPDTISESGSVAKQFTAAAVVTLAQRGKLSLDDPIRQHLPELPSPLMDGIVVRMLLNHTSGIRDIHGLFDLMGRPSYSSFHTNAEVLQVMSRQRDLNFAPGTEYLYSNGAYVLAAVLVERVSGKSFAAFCAEEIFKPRGMTHTRWREDFTALVPGRALGYDSAPGGGYRIDMPYSNIIGNGGLLTTVGDLLKWNASLDQPTGEWAAVVRALETPSTLKSGRVLDYGLGLSIDEEGGVREVSHGGATSGYRTFLARFPEQNVSFALLGNAGDFNAPAVSRALARAVLNLPPVAGPKRVVVEPAALARVAGLYHSAGTDDLLNLVVRDGKLLADGAEIIPTGPDAFATASGRTRYVFVDAPARITVTTHNGVAEYARVPVAKPTAAQLAAYAGAYRSEELDVTHHVTVNGGRLAVTHWPATFPRAEPTFADSFILGRGWQATFTRDADGKINGYELTNGRCRRVKFVRQG